MFKLVHRAGPFGDCTSSYWVELDKEYTVVEFVDTVLKEEPGEWGYIGIHKEREIFGDPCCKYSHGELTTDPLPEDILNKKIGMVTASGGWSRMDYRLYLED